MAEGDLSMLDKMASGIMERKEAAAARAKLTPVRGEKAVAPTVVAGMPIVPAAQFPNDQPGEVVIGVIRELDRQIGHLQEARDALAILVGADAPADQPKAGTTAADVVKAETKAAEFAADFAAKQREAQASAFTPAIAAAQAAADAGGGPLEVMQAAMAVADSTVEGGEDPDPAPAGWVCPDHGTRKDTKSRKGREMVACGSYPTECQKFEMP